MRESVLVVLGAGGMGEAIAHRVGSGKAILLADSSDEVLARASEAIRSQGHAVSTHRVDVSSPDSVRDLAQLAASLGRVTQVGHTAGLSPAQATSAAILSVDLLGVALVLEEFGRVVAPGGAGVVISSMAGHLAPPLSPEEEQALANTPPGELLQLPLLLERGGDDPGGAYALAKRANQIMVQAASLGWGARGARVNSISPGIVSTPMGRLELSSPVGDLMRSMVDSSPARRLGTPDDIASVASFLLGPESTFITGTDVLVDGGVVAALRFAGSSGATSGDRY
ncbi:MAG TPA: SDR family oxidoreductase [Acidimicrobiales bacterium]